MKDKLQIKQEKYVNISKYQVVSSRITRFQFFACTLSIMLKLLKWVFCYNGGYGDFINHVYMKACCDRVYHTRGVT